MRSVKSQSKNGTCKSGFPKYLIKWELGLTVTLFFSALAELIGVGGRGQESVKYAISSSEDTEAATVTAIRSLIIAIIKNNMNPYYIWHSAKQKRRLL
jgi:hypothetical protein